MPNTSITRSLAGTRYDALQLDMRRRLSGGLLVTANYTYAKRAGTSAQSFRFDRIYLSSTEVPHAFKTQWTWAVPVGRDRSQPPGPDRGFGGRGVVVVDHRD